MLLARATWIGAAMIERRTWDEMRPASCALNGLILTQPAGVLSPSVTSVLSSSRSCTSKPAHTPVRPTGPIATTQHTVTYPFNPTRTTEDPKHQQAPKNMRAFLLVALLACLALASAFVPRAALPKKAALAVRSKLAPFQRCVCVSGHVYVYSHWPIDAWVYVVKGALTDPLTPQRCN